MRRSRDRAGRPDGSSRCAVLPPSVFGWTLGIDLSIPGNHSAKFGVVVAMWNIIEWIRACG
jgi:hypothetical protein